MSTIKDLQPQAIWKNFYLLTQVPRPSGHLEKVQEFLLNWAKEKGVEAKKDEAGNILMYKPASAGMENCKMVTLQGHMDMGPQQVVERHANCCVVGIGVGCARRFVRMGESQWHHAGR